MKFQWYQPNYNESAWRAEPVSWIVFKVYNSGGFWRAGMYCNAWQDLGDYDLRREAKQGCVNHFEHMINEAREMIFKEIE